MDTVCLLTLPAMEGMTTSAHTKAIRETARNKFKGLGLKQKGQSRLWYLSGDYYTILVEFQPSSWSTGTYLNVGVDFNWYIRDYFAFEFGDRLSDFKSFQDEKKFEEELERLCDLAVDKVKEYKLIFDDSVSAADKLLKFYKNELNDWDKFNIGVLFALGGQTGKAMNYLKKVSGNDYKLDWEIERAGIARNYMKAIEEGNFLDKLDDVIRKTRELKKIS